MATLLSMPNEVIFQILSLLTSVGLPDSLRKIYLASIQLPHRFPLRHPNTKGFVYFGLDTHPFLALAATSRRLHYLTEAFCATHLSTATPARTRFLENMVTKCNTVWCPNDISDRAFIFMDRRLCSVCVQANGWKARVTTCAKELVREAGTAWVRHCDWPLELRAGVGYWRDDLPGEELFAAVRKVARGESVEKALAEVRFLSMAQMDGLLNRRARRRCTCGGRCVVM